MDAAGRIWGFVVVLGGGLVLGGVILWAMLKNRKEPQSEIDRTEVATHDLYEAQDAQDKHAQDKHAQDRSDDAAS